jgi:hypothetical protein
VSFTRIHNLSTNWNRTQRKSRKKGTKYENLKKVEQKIAKQRKAIKINNALFIDCYSFRK